MGLVFRLLYRFPLCGSGTQTRASLIVPIVYARPNLWPNPEGGAPRWSTSAWGSHTLAVQRVLNPHTSASGHGAVTCPACTQRSFRSLFIFHTVSVAARAAVNVLGSAAAHFISSHLSELHHRPRTQEATWPSWSELPQR